VNASPTEGNPQRSREQPTILVVEDDVVIRFTICDALRQHGYKVLEASSASEAIAILKTLPVQLIFADVRLPGAGDGISVADYGRAAQPDTKIILTSGKVHRSAMGDLQSLGPFVLKPYIIANVIQLIDRCLAPDGA
jgi:CheY-like chemotaxis protein